MKPVIIYVIYVVCCYFFSFFLILAQSIIVFRYSSDACNSVPKMPSNSNVRIEKAYYVNIAFDWGNFLHFVCASSNFKSMCNEVDVFSFSVSFTSWVFGRRCTFCNCELVVCSVDRQQSAQFRIDFVHVVYMNNHPNGRELNKG